MLPGMILVTLHFVTNLLRPFSAGSDLDAALLHCVSRQYAAAPAGGDTVAAGGQHTAGDHHMEG
jgi:hypothetical protein